MIRTDAWQMQIREEFQKVLIADQNIVALALFGSAISSQKVDATSDLDFLIIVRDEQFSHYFPKVEWLKPLGELFAFQPFEDDFHGTLRVCFFDFRRLDILVTTPSRLEQLASWNNNPFWAGVRIIFSRSEKVTQCLAQTWQLPTPMYPSQADFDGMVNAFWFKAMLAGYKVLRDDRLIASHLALDLVRDCCVLGMILRDRATGTNIHREGGEGNHLIDAWDPPLTSYSARDILNGIERSSIRFDQLASQWSEAYHERHSPLLEWLDHIRKTIDKKINSSL